MRARPTNQHLFCNAVPYPISFTDTVLKTKHTADSYGRFGLARPKPLSPQTSPGSKSKLTVSSVENTATVDACTGWVSTLGDVRLQGGGGRHLGTTASYGLNDEINFIVVHRLDYYVLRSATLVSSCSTIPVALEAVI